MASREACCSLQTSSESLSTTFARTFKSTLKISRMEVGKTAQSAKHLPCKHKDMSSIPRTSIKDMGCASVHLASQC